MVVEMRISIDIDKKSILKVLLCLIKGTMLCKRLPYKIRQTKKGVHIVWSGLDIDEKTMYIYRKVLKDDRTRISLDRASPKRLKQVLFCEKTVTTYGFMYHRGERIKRCPKCNQRILFSIESRDSPLVKVNHYDNECTIYQKQNKWKLI